MRARSLGLVERSRRACGSYSGVYSSGASSSAAGGVGGVTAALFLGVPFRGLTSCFRASLSTASARPRIGAA